MLAGAIRVLHGQTLYAAAGSFPYALCPYGPIGYWLVAAATTVGGVSLPAARVVPFTSALVAAGLLVWTGRSLGASWAATVILAAAFFCHPLVWVWMPLLRVDLPALAFALAGLLVFVRWRTIPLAAALFGAAALTKQTTVAAPIACAMELVFMSRWRDLSLLALCGSAFALSALVAQGGDPLFPLVRTPGDPL